MDSGARRHQPVTPEGPGPPDAFISYAREQKDFVTRLAEGVRARGKSAWIDWKDIRPTADWRAEVRAGIEEARAFVFVLGPESLASEICEEELVHAIGANKRLVPVVASDVDPERVPGELAAPNWIFCRPQDDFEAAVDTLVEALETDLDWLDHHARLLVRATEWKRDRSDASYLLRGSDLAAAEAWLAQEAEHRERATPLQREYVAAGRESATRRRRAAIGTGAVAVVVAAGLAILAWQQSERAGTEADRAESRSLAAASIELVPTDPWEALELAIDAAQTSQTPEATDALRRALEAPRESAILELSGDAVTTARFGPDSTHLVTTSHDGKVRRWSLDTGESEIVRPQRRPRLGEAAVEDLSPDGSLRLTPGLPGVRLSDARVGNTLIELDRLGGGLEGGTRAARFDPDGSSFVTVGYDPTARVWPLTVRRLGHGDVEAAAIGADGRECLTANADRTARLWSCADGEQLASWSLPPPEFGNRYLTGEVRVSFGADGSRIVASVGSTTAVHDAETGEELIRVRGSPRLRAPPAISPTGRVAVRALSRRSAEIVELPGERRIATVPSEFPVTQAAFSADDRRVATSSRNDPIVRIWDRARPGEPTAIGPFDSPVEDLDLSNDGSLLLTARGTSAELWDSASGERVRAFPARDLVFTAAFGAEERFVITAGAEGARIWETSTGRPVAAYAVDPAAAADASLGANGRVVAVGLRGSAFVFDCVACQGAPELLAEAEAAIANRP